MATVVFKLPGFSTAHNGRMVIFILLGLALLAGWGLDELSERASRRRCGARRLALGGGRGASSCVPVVWMLVAGTHRPGHVLRPALKVAWGFEDPPTPAAGSCRRSRRRPRRSSG